VRPVGAARESETNAGYQTWVSSCSVPWLFENLAMPLFAKLRLVALLCLSVAGCNSGDGVTRPSVAQTDGEKGVANNPLDDSAGQGSVGQDESDTDSLLDAISAPEQSAASVVANNGSLANYDSSSDEGNNSIALANDALDERPKDSGGTATPAELTSAPSPRFGPRRPPPGQEVVEDKPLSPIEKARRAAARRRGDLTFDDLKFEIEKGGEFKRDMLSEDIESFGGRTIKIRGYMYPTYKQDGITEFVLVRDNLECCFGPGAAIYDCIRIRMAAGKTTSFSVRPISVKGKFEIEEFRLPDGYLAAIFKMTATEVR